MSGDLHYSDIIHSCHTFMIVYKIKSTFASSLILIKEIFARDSSCEMKFKISCLKPPGQAA